MKNLVVPILAIVFLVALFIIGISSQALVLVIASCGAWTPVMIAIGYYFAHRGVSGRSLFTPMIIIAGLGVGGIAGLSSNIIPLMLVSCMGIIPALIFAGWSLARAGDGDMPTRAMPPTPKSTILTEDEIKRVVAIAENKKKQHRQKVVTANGRGEFD